MLNPDGVANGYTRLDTNGFNLNARYKFTNDKTPSIYALKKLIGYLSSRKVLHAYLDLHAHTTKRGIFFFANPLTESNYKQTLEIPYLFYIFQKQFTFTGSRFGVEKGESTSRKEFYRMTKCNRLYVLETNYWGETQSLKSLKEKKLIKDNLRTVKNFGRFYNLPKFAEIGVNLAKTILKAGDMENIRNMGVTSQSLIELDRDIEKKFAKLKAQSNRRKLKKVMKAALNKRMKETNGENSPIKRPSKDRSLDFSTYSDVRATMDNSEEMNTQNNHLDVDQDPSEDEVFKGQVTSHTTAVSKKHAESDYSNTNQQ